MRNRLFFRAALGVIVAGIVALAVVASLPWLASTRLVRDRIAQELGVWSGYRVELRERPDIEIWPSFRAVLNNVTFAEASAGPGKPALTAQRIEVDMSALAALHGSVYFNRVRFVRPVLRVSPDARLGFLPDLPPGGKIRMAVDDARHALDADETQPDLSGLPDDDLGTIEFADARIVMETAQGDRELARSLTGAINWPALNRGGALTVQGLWRGQNIAVDIASLNPLLHLAGGNAGLRASLRSTPLTASFDGTAGLSPNAFIEGVVQVSSQAIRRALTWLQVDVGSTTMVNGPFDFSSQIAGTSTRMEFKNTSVAVNGNPGIGVFDVALDGPVPAISGTLAFDVLDLPTALTILSPLLPRISGAPAPAFTLIDRVALDLRLSAQRGQAGPVSLSEIAATAQITPGHTVLDISDATLLGGRLQAGIRVERKPESDQQVKVTLRASDIDGGTAGDALQLPSAIPAARGTISLDLSGAGETWGHILETASGSFQASFGRGDIRNIDLDRFLARLQEGGFFSLADATGGRLAIDGAQAKATMERGVARVSRAAVDTATRSIIMQGIVPYEGGLALTGDVFARDVTPQTTQSTGDQPPPKPVASFFVGGGWSAPFISSMGLRLPTSQPQQ